MFKGRLLFSKSIILGIYVRFQGVIPLYIILPTSWFLRDFDSGSPEFSEAQNKSLPFAIFRDL